MDEAPALDILDASVLDKAKAPGTHFLLGTVESQDLGLRHDRVALRFIQSPRVDQLDLDTALEGPIQMIIILTLHHVDVEAEKSGALQGIRMNNWKSLLPSSSQTYFG